MFTTRPEETLSVSIFLAAVTRLHNNKPERLCNGAGNNFFLPFYHDVTK